MKVYSRKFIVVFVLGLLGLKGPEIATTLAATPVSSAFCRDLTAKTGNPIHRLNRELQIFLADALIHSENSWIKANAKKMEEMEAELSIKFPDLSPADQDQILELLTLYRETHRHQSLGPIVAQALLQHLGEDLKLRLKSQRNSVNGSNLEAAHKRLLDFRKASLRGMDPVVAQTRAMMLYAASGRFNHWEQRPQGIQYFQDELHKKFFSLSREDQVEILRVFGQISGQSSESTGASVEVAMSEIRMIRIRAVELQNRPEGDPKRKVGEEVNRLLNAFLPLSNFRLKTSDYLP